MTRSSVFLPVFFCGNALKGGMCCECLRKTCILIFNLHHTLATYGRKKSRHLCVYITHSRSRLTHGNLINATQVRSWKQESGNHVNRQIFAWTVCVCVCVCETFRECVELLVFAPREKVWVKGRILNLIWNFAASSVKTTKTKSCELFPQLFFFWCFYRVFFFHFEMTQVLS